MPPRRKRLDIDVMSSVVREKPIVQQVVQQVAQPVKPVKPIKAKINIKSKLIKKRFRKQVDSSSSECNTPPEIEYLPVITETPEKKIDKRTRY